MTRGCHCLCHSYHTKNISSEWYYKSVRRPPALVWFVTTLWLRSLLSLSYGIVVTAAASQATFTSIQHSNPLQTGISFTNPRTQRRSNYPTTRTVQQALDNNNNNKDDTSTFADASTQTNTPKNGKKELKICSLTNGLDLTRLHSHLIRSIFEGIMEDTELMREYLTEALYNDGVKPYQFPRGVNSLDDLNRSLDVAARNMTPGTTTLEADLGYVDDRKDRRMELYVTTSENQPYVGTKETDLRLMIIMADLLPWMRDRRAREDYWAATHQDGRTEGPDKDTMPYHALYTSAWSLSPSDVLATFPPFTYEYGHPFTIADIVKGNFSYATIPDFLPIGWPFAHRTDPARLRDALIALPYADLWHPGRAILSALAPVYYTGTWQNYTYDDTFITTMGLSVELDSIARVLDHYEDTLAKGSFALLVDTETFRVASISQSVVRKIYPPFPNQTSPTLIDIISRSLIG
jgi:hypothetical protein